MTRSCTSATHESAALRGTPKVACTPAVCDAIQEISQRQAYVVEHVQRPATRPLRIECAPQNGDIDTKPVTLSSGANCSPVKRTRVTSGVRTEASECRILALLHGRDCQAVTCENLPPTTRWPRSKSLCKDPATRHLSPDVGRRHRHQRDPAPSARCPFEQFHKPPEPVKVRRPVYLWRNQYGDVRIRLDRGRAAQAGRLSERCPRCT